MGQILISSRIGVYTSFDNRLERLAVDHDIECKVARCRTTYVNRLYTVSEGMARACVVTRKQGSSCSRVRQNSQV